MRKQTGRRRRTTHARQAAIPPGLAAAFKMIDTGGSTNTAAHSFATKAHPHALRILDLLHGDGSVDLAVEQELTAAAARLFPTLSDQQVPELARLAGFHVGFAACWLLMMAVNGRGGAQ